MVKNVSIKSSACNSLHVSHLIVLLPVRPLDRNWLSIKALLFPEKVHMFPKNLEISVSVKCIAILDYFAG